jgi:hypothetical protein
VLGTGKLVALVEQEARKHSLFEAAEDKKECSTLDDGCDPAGPAPAASVCNSATSDEPETMIELVCAVVK